LGCDGASGERRKSQIEVSGKKFPQIVEISDDCGEKGIK
jgi:hypothetical protein